ncbi:transglycosylase domain-containing protein [Curtobacterium sp. RRHDQ10]|uniref:transglycosylase domain-containing protein n=1 Tax=Curtobacterium phyllosphaerae TaxID=3413379 RepID=UPI003BF15BD7
MSAQKTKPVSAVGAFIGFVGFSALAGLLVTIGVTPAIAVAGVTTTSTIGVFESLPEYIEIGDLPQRNELYAYQNGQPVQFATVYDQNRQELTYDQIAGNLKFAAIDGEDRRFWEHGGVDVPSLVRAGLGSVAGGGLGDSGGASTLTMQLVRNIKMQQALEKPTKEEQVKAYNDAVEQTIPRKLEEMKLAIGLAKKYTKKQILTAYLNIAFFGDNTYGVQAAAQHYYGKDATNLNAEEAASILAIVQSPNTRNLSDPKNYEANQGRRDVILNAMYAAKHIDKATLTAALATKPADYVHLTPATQGCQASAGAGSQFFCDYAVKVVKQMDQLGATDKERAAAWRTGGYKIQTTLDLDLNADQKAILDKYDRNTETRLALGAVSDSLESSTGRILTMAQNKDYDQSQTSPPTSTSINYSVDHEYGGGIGFQTGSTYKLFTLLDWLENGHGLNEVVNGTPHNQTVWERCGETYRGNWAPKNDSIGERGNFSVIAATAASVNAAFASMAAKLDLCDIRDNAKKLGVHPADGNAELNSYPSSVLGTNNIAPMTMAAAYATIANNGIYCKPIAIDNITSADGKSLGGQQKECNQVIDPSVAQTAVYALKRTISGGTAVGAQTADGMQMFGKTGTTDDADQIWLVGGTSRVTTAYWQGNTDGKLMNLRHYSNGVRDTYAGARASVFKQLQTPMNAQYPAGAFTNPSGSAINGNTIAVPDVSGKTTADAQTTLAGAGFTFVDGGTQAGSAAAGTVSSTSPAAGALLSKGASVTVYTSDGSQANVPDVTGKVAKDAAATLNGAGYESVAVAGQFQKGANGQACKVVSTTPAANTAAPKTQQIILNLYGTPDGKDPGNCS